MLQYLWNTEIICFVTHVTLWLHFQTWLLSFHIALGHNSINRRDKLSAGVITSARRSN